jgi:Flp pilus assembly pilin Flp
MMFPLLQFLRKYWRENVAVTAVEYGLIASGISLTIVFGVFFFGEAVLAIFNTMLAEISEFAQQAGVGEGD